MVRQNLRARLLAFGKMAGGLIPSGQGGGRNEPLAVISH
jgi:hypothetical protein